MKVNLHIERLVLDGLDAGAPDGDSIGHAVQLELTRLLQAGAPPLSRGYSVASARAAPWTLPARPDGAALGRGVAQSVYGELGGRAAAPRRRE